jgi:hypothetical protein
MNPSTTLTLFSQPPDLGRFLSHDGKIAKSVNGKAKARENASMVTTGSQISPWVDFTIIVPTMGPVHENETNTSVKAMKKVPISPPLSAFESALFTIQLGKTISKAPKNDAANIINIAKKSRFGIQCVDSQLKISAVTDSPPKK